MPVEAFVHLQQVPGHGGDAKQCVLSPPWRQSTSHCFALAHIVQLRSSYHITFERTAVSDQDRKTHLRQVPGHGGSEARCVVALAHIV